MNKPDNNEWQKMWEQYKPYILNDMTFTFAVMLIMFIIAGIFIL